MPQVKDKRRTVLACAVGVAAVVVGAFAIGAPGPRSDQDGRAAIVTDFGEFTAAHETVLALQWLSTRGGMNGFRFNPQLELTHVRVVLEPAGGVSLPAGAFQSDSVRFDEAGRVLDIVLAAPGSEGAHTDWEQDPIDARYWYASVEDECPLGIDLATRELTRNCRR
jgi:hypothetical protein